MTPELWERLKPLFDAALEKGLQDRAGFVNDACNGDAKLKKHLEQLLEAEQQATKPLDAPLANIEWFLKDRSARFHPGELVLGRFRIIRPIGKGGMGEVYETEDLQLGTVALKTIRQTIASTPDSFERFRQEVELARRVSGPQVCRIHELYLLPETVHYKSTAFLTMEYLNGITLFEKIQRDGPLPWKEAISIALEICEGLRLIHEKGIVHRDLKTGNIMLCEQTGDMRVVLMDFGLARDFRSDIKRDSPNLIQRPGKPSLQMMAGTPEYMAPEQFEIKPVSPATDIYALGIILYELFTGLHPYAADTPVAAAIRRAKHPRPPSFLKPNIPKRFDRVIERCLEYEPENRFQLATEVAQALRAGPATFENLRKDRPWTIWLISAVMFALIAGGSYFFWQSRQYYRPSAEAFRWYDAGQVALREGNYVKATRSLQGAIALDSHFVMAHARLAEAWADLDFDGNAQRELLVATPGRSRLRPLDRIYLDAINATITKDYAREITLYRQILTRLPPNQKSSGYVDLGMAYERASDPKQALENYSEAASLDRDNPAPFMHTAVLQSRQHNVPEATRAFERVQSLFAMEVNQEGQAELDYARGYAANDVGNVVDAKRFLELSLEEANRIPSVQLQIRVLTQLSSVASRSDAAPQAAKYAQQAIRLARENQLDAWAANGLVRLATAQINLGKLQDAEESLQDALRLSRQTQQLRAEALANLTLANLMNQENRTDRVLAPAEAALDYYKKNGYFVPAANASILLIRTERDSGQYQRALSAGKVFLDLAAKSDISELMRQAEEVLGTVFLEMEQFPNALLHFQNAKALASTGSSREYEAINSADTLWRIGRYAESEEMLRFNPVNDTLARLVDVIRTQSLLSDGKYGDVLHLAKETLKYPTLAVDDIRELELDKIIAEARLGMKKQSLTDWDAWINEEKGSNSVNDAEKNLAAAQVDVANGLSQQAYDNGVRAAAQFASTGKLDSELHSVCLVALAAKALKDKAEYDTYSAKAVDIVSQIQQDWSVQVSRTYLSRPDLQMLMRGIPVTAQSK